MRARRRVLAYHSGINSETGNETPRHMVTIFALFILGFIIWLIIWAVQGVAQSVKKEADAEPKVTCANGHEYAVSSGFEFCPEDGLPLG